MIAQRQLEKMRKRRRTAKKKRKEEKVKKKMEATKGMTMERHLRMKGTLEIRNGM